MYIYPPTLKVVERVGFPIPSVIRVEDLNFSKDEGSFFPKPRSFHGLSKDQVSLCGIL